MFVWSFHQCMTILSANIGLPMWPMQWRVTTLMSKQMKGKWRKILSSESCTAFSVLSNSLAQQVLDNYPTSLETCPKPLDNLQIYCVCIIFSPTHDHIECWYWVTNVANTVTRYRPSTPKQMEWEILLLESCIAFGVPSSSSHNKLASPQQLSYVTRNLFYVTKEFANL